MIGIRPPIVSALEALKPKAQWTLGGDSYAGLQWLDKTQTKPTEQEVEEKIREDLKNKNIENSQENFQEELPTTSIEENNKKDDSEAKKEFREEVKSSYGIKRYKIQEVIKPGQVVLIQFIKEERGQKGAALTTFISLA